MADERADLMGSARYKEKTRPDGTLSPEDQADFKVDLAKREKVVVAQLAIETATEQKRAIEDAKIAAIQAQAEVLKATANTAEKRIEIEKWADAETRKVRQQAPKSEEESKADDERAKWEKQGEAANKARQQAEEMSGIFRDGIHTGMEKGIMAGLKSISQRLQQAMLDKEIEKLANKLAGVPNDPNDTDERSLLQQVLGRPQKQKQQPKTESNANNETDEEGYPTVNGNRAAGPPVRQASSASDSDEGDDSGEPSYSIQDIVDMYPGGQGYATSMLDMMAAADAPSAMPNVGGYKPWTPPNSSIIGPTWAGWPGETQGSAGSAQGASQPPAYTQLPPFVQNLLNSGSLGFGGLLGGGHKGAKQESGGKNKMEATSVVINTPNAVTNAARVTINQRGASAGGAEGGSGSSPSAEQALGAMSLFT